MQAVKYDSTMRFVVPEELLTQLRRRRTELRPTEGVSGAPALPAGARNFLQHAVALPSAGIEQVASEHLAEMEALQGIVEDETDAFLLDSGMGPTIYLTSRGLVLIDGRLWDGEPIREATESEAIGGLVIGATKTGIQDLLKLIPEPPADSSTCPECGGTRWSKIAAGLPHTIVCFLCGGRGWVTASMVDDARARRIWPRRNEES